VPNYVSASSALDFLSKANRVLVIGCSGGGKSTLSIRISEQYGLKYISMDRDVRWLPGWVVRDRQEQRDRLRDFVQGERWVMDGTSHSSFDIRLPRTDLVLWVRVPRRVALMGVTRRVTRFLGSVRPDMAEGCPEILPDLEFLSYIWNFEKKYSPKIIEKLDELGPDIPVLILKSRAEVNQWISE